LRRRKGCAPSDPVETAADKLSALAWRVHARDRASPEDDPTIIRHLHDLAALGIWRHQSDGRVIKAFFIVVRIISNALDALTECPEVLTSCSSDTRADSRVGGGAAGPPDHKRIRGLVSQRRSSV
jgi:hypothetical protein